MNKNTIISRRTLLALACTPIVSLADNQKEIEHITVTSRHIIYNEQKQAQGDVNLTDASAWLNSVPGAAVNKNGATSGIAQYRGLYGDRVAVKLNGLNVLGAGPNAMDAPMSYVPNNLIDNMSVYRGITPVSAGVDSLGGAIDISLKQAEFAPNSQFESFGQVQLGYNQQGDSWNFAPMVNLAKGDRALLIYGSQQSRDDQKTADELAISPSRFDKRLYGMDYQYLLANGQVGFAVHSTDTNEAGTPALPMDVDYIEANRFEFNGDIEWFNHEIKWSLGYLDAEHGMDNYSLRHNMNDSMYRYNTAAAIGTNLKFHASRMYDFGRLTYGVDGYWSKHDSTVTSPNDAMFNILNFNQVEDNRFGVFIEYDKTYDKGKWSLGLRLKHHEQDAGDVNHHMAMMNENIMMLKNQFNQADKKDNKSLHDLAINWQHELQESLQLSVGLGRKQRAASYQALYLWLPMQSTGGLADGRTYIGNINLEPETANQLNLGLIWQNDRVQISPNLFYQKIQDYIQAVPSNNMAANMVSNMMTGKMPLQFANVEAELQGFDLDVKAQLSNNWSIDMIATYVTGERTDINDNLYRVSPANLSMTANYQRNNWQVRLNWHLFAKQDKVSAINEEKPTPGYGLVNLSGRVSWPKVQLHAGIRNLMDKTYTDHLAGTNRVTMSDIPAGNKLPGAGRDVYAALVYSF